MSFFCISLRNYSQWGSELGQGIRCQPSPIWKMCYPPTFQNDPELHIRLSFLSFESAHLAGACLSNSPCYPNSSVAHELFWKLTPHSPSLSRGSSLSQDPSHKDGESAGSFPTDRSPLPAAPGLTSRYP